MMKNPPTPTSPDRAFVTADRIPSSAQNPTCAAYAHMSGEWRAGVTLHTARKPTIPARPSTVNRFINAGPVSLPNAKAVPIPPVVSATERTLSCHGVTATTGVSALAIWGRSALT